MKIAIIANPEKKEAPQVIKDLWDSFPPSRSFSFLLDKRLASLLKQNRFYASDEKMAKTADVLIVLGGDGTLLHAVKRVAKSGLPVLGVNLGGMGFLTEFSPLGFLNQFPNLLKKKYYLDFRTLLEVSLVTKGRQGPWYESLNDAVITKGSLSRMLSLDVSVDDKSLTTYRSDGLIVATPTGSTAHSLSSGGPIVESHVGAILITPICPHTLSNRPLVISDKSEIRIQLTSFSEKVGLTLDGQVGFELRQGDGVVIRKAKRTIPLIRFDYDYYQVLREKLGWRGSSV